MPYERIQDLPAQVREHLPKHAQEIYQEAFNSAYEQYAEPAKRREGDSREAIAHRVAWGAVETAYKKNDEGRWVPRGG